MALAKSMTIGKKIKLIREAKRLSLGDLAKACGISKGNLSKLENDKQDVLVGSLRKIATHLDVSASALID